MHWANDRVTLGNLSTLGLGCHLLVTSKLLFLVSLGVKTPPHQQVKSCSELQYIHNNNNTNNKTFCKIFNNNNKREKLVVKQVLVVKIASIKP